jgi:hypothetical protein
MSTINPLEELQSKIKDYKDKIKETKKELRDKIRVHFTDLSKELIKSYPSLKSFSWSQYNDYYDDCDTYPFKAFIDYPYVNGEDYQKDHKWQLMKEGVVAFLRPFKDDENTLEILFGGDVRVTVTPEGISTKTENY